MKPLGVKLWSLSGSSFEIGSQHGEILKAEIKENFDFYTKVLLKIPAQELADFGHAYLALIEESFPDFGEEIRGIASGANLEPWRIALLNARTELFLKNLKQPIGECTSIYLAQAGLLGQTWDWMQALEKGFTIFQVEKANKPKLVFLTEPGIIGKIGMNAAGVGVCLNILIGKLRHFGLPAHVLCRALMECASLAEVRALLARLNVGTCSHLLVADAASYLSLEFANQQRAVANYGSGPIVHTNHYLALELEEAVYDPGREGSDLRLARAQELAASRSPACLNSLSALLLDEKNGDHAICREYQPFLGQIIGTVALVLMDLKRKEFYYSPGAPRANGMEKVVL